MTNRQFIEIIIFMLKYFFLISLFIIGIKHPVLGLLIITISVYVQIFIALEISEYIKPNYKKSIMSTLFMFSLIFSISLNILPKTKYKIASYLTNEKITTQKIYDKDTEDYRIEYLTSSNNNNFQRLASILSYSLLFISLISVYLNFHIMIFFDKKSESFI